MRALAVVAALAASSVASAQDARFIAGEATHYRIDYSNTTHSDLRVLFGMDTSSTMPSPLVHDIVSEVHGTLEQRVFQRDSVVHIAFNFRGASVSLKANGVNAESEAEKIRDHLAKRVFATLTPAGKILSVSFDPSVDDRSRVFARTLFASMQFVVPQNRQTTWRSQEEDPAGVYEASYTSRGTSFTKQKLRYLPQAPQKTRSGFTPATQTIVPSGSASASFDHVGALVSIESDEQQRVTVADKPIANGTTKFRLRRTMATTINEGELARLRTLERDYRALAERLFMPEAGARSDTALQRTELGTATSSILLARLADLEKTRSDSASSTELYLKFKALVYLHPESSDELGRTLLAATPNGPTMLIVSQALGTVGHSQAQAALARVIRSRFSEWPALATLITVLGGVSTPTDETVHLIVQLAFESANTDVRSTARLAAGTLARNLELQSSARATAIVNRLVAALERSTSSNEKRELLLAVGNTGAASALPAIERLARDKDQSIRAAAYFAMRFIDSKSVDSQLLNASRTDPDSTVRSSATRILDQRKSR